MIVYIIDSMTIYMDKYDFLPANRLTTGGWLLAIGGWLECK